MITLLVIGTLIFTLKIVLLALKAAWGLTKGVFFVLALPLILAGMVIVGLIHLAVPVLVVGLLAAFIVPALKSV